MSTTATTAHQRVRVPRNHANDYTHEMAAERREFVRERTGVELSHLAQYSFDPAILPGNIENFAGIAQVPIGIAGPLQINGDNAQLIVAIHGGCTGLALSGNAWNCLAAMVQARSINFGDLRGRCSGW